MTEPRDETQDEMYSDPWRPYALALRDHFTGDRAAVVTSHSDLFPMDEDPAAVFFRAPEAFWPFERAALELCRGRVLDVGAGAGVHALYLQERGHEVCAIDQVPEAVEIMRERGVRDARVADMLEDVRELEAEPFDTILMLMNGLGIVETLDGLERFLREVPRLLTPGGQIVADSTDVRSLGDSDDRAPGRPLREDGRYIGEVQFQLEYRGVKAPPFAQLCVDPDTLSAFAERTGWRCEIVFEGEGGGYVTRLTR